MTFSRKRPSRGQALPMLLIVLPILLAFWGLTLQEGFLAAEKIRLQRRADEAALLLANDHARALNGIAMLNQGLAIVRRRVRLMHATWISLTACSAFNPGCAKALSRLAPKLRPFYRKSEKLGQALAQKQDQLARWATHRTSTAELYFGLHHPGVSYKAYTATPEKPYDLGVRRETQAFSDPIADIPAPMESIAGVDRRIGFRVSHPASVDFRPFASRIPLPMFALSEAQGKGFGLNHPSFTTDLVSLRAYRNFWARSSLRDPNAPPLQEFEHELTH